MLMGGVLGDGLSLSNAAAMRDDMSTETSQPAADRTLLRQSSVDYLDAEKGEAVRNMFAGIARKYDALNHLLSFNRDKSWRRFAVKLAAVKPGERILDVCCGTGDLAMEFRKQHGADHEIHGTDFTPEMIEIAKQKSDAGKCGISYQVADTLALPYPDQSFDVISVGFGIRNVQNVRAGIREMARVLKPGGRMVILEFSKPQGYFFKNMYDLYSTRVMPLMGNAFSSSKEKAYSYLADSIALFPGPDQLAEMMEEEGMSDVFYRTRIFGVVAIHVGTKA